MHCLKDRQDHVMIDQQLGSSHLIEVYKKAPLPTSEEPNFLVLYSQTPSQAPQQHEISMAASTQPFSIASSFPTGEGNMTEAQLSEWFTNFENPRFEDDNFEEMNFEEMDFEGVNFEGMNFEEMNFEDAMLHVTPGNTSWGDNWTDWPHFGDTPKPRQCREEFDFLPMAINLSQELAKEVAPGPVQDTVGRSVIAESEEQDLPEKSESPEEPGSPEEQESPEESESPERSQSPVELGSPGKSQSPEEPESPDRSQSPEEPESPDRSQSPEEPESPEEPDEETSPGLVQVKKFVVTDKQQTEVCFIYIRVGLCSVS
jgi:hypothetical protein